MPSKRDGSIQPSVTSQPPRHTARTGRGGYEAGGGGLCWDGDDGGGFFAGVGVGRGVLLAWDKEQRREAHRHRRTNVTSGLKPPRKPIGLWQALLLSSQPARHKRSWPYSCRAAANSRTTSSSDDASRPAASSEE